MHKKIMFVDDEPDQLFTFRQSLREINPDYEFIGIDSAKACLEQLEQGVSPDVIFLDILMPGMNGLELYAKIKQHPIWQTIPIVFLTAQSIDSSSLMEKIFADLYDKYEHIYDSINEFYIEKPIEIKQVIRKIDIITQDSS